MDEDSVPPNPSTQTPPTSDHKDSHLKSNVGKLDFKDAKFADSPLSEECTLILTTQGGYAEHFARGVLSVLGNKKYAVFPLKGKVLNVRADPKQLLNNATIQKIIEILGLQPGKHYEDVKELRYGHLMFMVTQGSHDGSHIIGLLINFLFHHFPSLLKVETFMRMFITPMVKAVHKKTYAVLSFYTLPDYHKWEEGLGNKVTDYMCHKGSEIVRFRQESKYFYADFDQHIKDFYWFDFEDEDAIDCAFGMNIDARNHYLGRGMNIDARNHYLGRKPQAGTSDDNSIRYRDFFTKEFMQYLEADRQRSIPSIVDGLTLDQRKIITHAFKMPLTQTIGVGQLSSYVIVKSPYDRETGSLVSTIIGMAQNYVGSNNINLLQPIGVFGTRRMGGKDHDARGSYLSTHLSPITRYLFHKADESIFKYLGDDGQSFELAWFIPIIPMILVNGFKGSGTECSSLIPKYNPRDIIANLIRLLNGRKVLPMDPWYKGFNGKIKKEKVYTTEGEKLVYTTEGLIEKGKTRRTIAVTELPVGMSTEKFRKHLEAALRRGDIKDFKEEYTDHYNDDKVHFEITMADQQMKSANQKEWLLNKLKLKTTISTSNMYLLDEDGLLWNYTTTEEILMDFFRIRLGFYEKWMPALLRELKIASGLLENRVKFIDKVRKGEIPLFPLKGKEGDWCAELKTKGIQSLPSINGEATEESYDYLWSVPNHWFSDEKLLEELKRESAVKSTEYKVLSTSTFKSLWQSELTALDHQLNKEKYTVKISSEDVDSEIAEEAPKMKARAKRPAARPHGANKKSRTR